jgi:hypothetical protein
MTRSRGESRRGSFRGKVTHNATQQRSKASNYGHLLLPRGVNVFEEDPGGRIALDILPYFVTDAHHPDRDEEFETAVEGSLWYRRPYKLHRSIGADNKAVVCLSSVGRKCPICEYRAKRIADGEKWDDQAIKAMRPSDRDLYYVVPKGSRKHEEKAYLWDISQFCFQALLNEELEENEEFGDFPDLEHGLTLIIRFSEEKFMNNSFAKASAIKFEERDGYDYAEKVVRDLPSLDDVLDVKEYREVERLFFEGGEEGEDDPQPREEERSQATQTIARQKSSAVTPLRRPAEPAEQPTTQTRPRRPPEAADDREDHPETVVTRRSSDLTRSSPAASGGGNGAAVGECPSGYRFGVDVDTKDECNECPVWNECMDAHDAHQPTAR